MDNVLALQMLDTELDAAICLSWASCRSAVSCKSNASGVIIIDDPATPGTIA